MFKKKTYYIYSEKVNPFEGTQTTTLKLREENQISRYFIAGLIFTLFTLIVGFQLKWSLAQAETDSPITSPVTSPEVSPEPSATPTPTPEPSNPSNSDNNNSNNNSSNGGAPSCNNQKPGSAPKIVSATGNGQNSVTLDWTKSADPLTHYLISYGLKPGIQLYGNPNVGNVTSYTVNYLSGGTIYYFRVRGVNDCTPGDPSNEVAVSVSGKKIIGPATDFKPGILGKTVIKANPKTYIKATPKPLNAQGLTKPTFFGIILSYLNNLFN